MSRFSLSGSLWLALPLLAVMAAGCDNGASCSPSCPSGISLCCDDGSGSTGMCRAILTDRLNCGACGTVCPSSCTNGVCDGVIRPDAGPPPDAPPIDAPRDVGGGACVGGVRMCGALSVSCTGFTGGANVDGRSDPSFTNCAICGRMCDPVTASRCAVAGGSSNPSCLCGSDTCLSGEECLNVSGAFRCIDVQTDRENCGTVGNRCAGTETCTDGMCACGGVMCGEGTQCCGGGAGATCIGTESDAANCGGCGVACGAGEVCEASMCVTPCGEDFCEPQTMTSLGELCCADVCVPQDSANCGGCGTVCDDPEEPCTATTDLFTMMPVICCTAPPPFPGFPAFCPPATP
jgi:hypothetical protein